MRHMSSVSVSCLPKWLASTVEQGFEVGAVERPGWHNLIDYNEQLKGSKSELNDINESNLGQ